MISNPSIFGKAYNFQISIFMKIRFTVLFFLVLICQAAQSATPPYYKLEVTTNKWVYGNRDSFLNGHVQRSVLEQLDSIYKKTPSNYEFLYSEESNSLKVFIQCSLDFYSVVEGRLIKEYQFQNRGYTCGSSLFLKEGNYYLVGGKGFWTNHMDLLRFDNQAGSWEFTQTKNQALDYFPIGVFHTESGITTLFGDYTNPRIPRIEKEFQGFFLDWKQKKWLPIKFETRGLDLSEIVTTNPSYFLETQDYGLLIINTQLPSLGWNVWVLVEKASGKLLLYEGPKSFEAINSPYREILGNKIVYFDYDEVSNTEGKEVLIDLGLIRSQSREIGQVVVLDAPEKTTDVSLLSALPWIGFPIVFLLALWLGIQIQKRKNRADQTPLDSETETEGEQESEEENAEILQRLLLHNGEKLNTEEFDSVLGIHEITNFDSKRIKRSRLIKFINKQSEEKNGFPLITRIKNSQDKRFLFYRITFENGN